MTCPSCGKDNPPQTKFCLACGGALPRRAPRPPPPRRQSMSSGSPPRRNAHTGGRRGGVEGAGAGIADPKTAGGYGGGGGGAGGCPSCGAPLEAHHRFCPSCGSQVSVGTTRPARGTSSAGTGARLTSLYPDGTEATAFHLSAGITTVGRDSGGVFAADQYLSPRHATFALQGGVVMVRDEASLNGVFRRIVHDQRYPLTHGQLFRIGQELIRFESLTPTPVDPDGVEVMGAPMDGYVGRIAMMVGRNTSSTAFPIPESGLSIGRERGEVLFADDGYVSGLHCRLSFESGSVYITDLGSSNGTFVRIDGSDAFHDGDVMLLGQQLFRVDL